MGLKYTIYVSCDDKKFQTKYNLNTLVGQSILLMKFPDFLLIVPLFFRLNCSFPKPTTMS